MSSATSIAPSEPPAPPAKRDARRTYTCTQCGHVLGVSGLGRHRVYFELDDERLVAPVMNQLCPACGHGLQGSNAR